MKHEKAFYCVCGIVFLITLMLIGVIIASVVKWIHISTGLMILDIIALFIMVFISFACYCILQTFIEEKKMRTVKKNAKWRK